MTSLAKPEITRNKTQAPLEEEDDVLDELPEVKPTVTQKFDGSKSTSTAESLVDFMEKFNWFI